MKKLLMLLLLVGCAAKQPITNDIPHMAPRIGEGRAVEVTGVSKDNHRWLYELYEDKLKCYLDSVPVDCEPNFYEMTGVTLAIRD